MVRAHVRRRPSFQKMEAPILGACLTSGWSRPLKSAAAERQAVSRTRETQSLSRSSCCRVRRSSGLNADYPGHPGTIPHLFLQLRLQ
jgi:hypothetical protein